METEPNTWPRLVKPWLDVVGWPWSFSPQDLFPVDSEGILHCFHDRVGKVYRVSFPGRYLLCNAFSSDGKSGQSGPLSSFGPGWKLNN